MPRPKGATDKRPRKRRATTPGAAVVVECERWFRKQFGRDFTPADRARIVEDMEGEPATLELPRRALVFLVLRDGRAAATGDPSDLGVHLKREDAVALSVALSFLVGVTEYTPVLHAGKTAAELLKEEKRTLEQQLATLVSAGAPIAELGVAGVAQVLVETMAQGQIRQALADRRYSDAAAKAKALAELPPHPRLLRRN